MEPEGSLPHSKVPATCPYQYYNLHSKISLKPPSVPNQSKTSHCSKSVQKLPVFQISLKPHSVPNQCKTSQCSKSV